MGHIMRCMALYFEFKRKGIESFFITREDEKALELLKKNKVNVLLVKGSTLKEELKDIKNYISSYDIDTILVDSYWINEDYLIVLKSMCNLLVSIDDNYLYNYKSHIVINPNLYASLNEYEINKGTKYLLGGDYLILRKEFRKKYIFKVNKKVQNVLITMGGSDVNNFTLFLINSLKGIKDINFNVVIGNGYKNFKAPIEKNVNLIYDPKNMREVMIKNDFAISGGGTTAYELASLSIPTVLIIQAENQVRIAEYMDKSKKMINLGWFNNITEGSIAYEVNNLVQDFNLRRELSINSGKDININGVINIVDKIVKNAK